MGSKLAGSCSSQKRSQAWKKPASLRKPECLALVAVDIADLGKAADLGCLVCLIVLPKANGKMPSRSKGLAACRGA